MIVARVKRRIVSFIWLLAIYGGSSLVLALDNERDQHTLKV